MQEIRRVQESAGSRALRQFKMTFGIGILTIIAVLAGSILAALIGRGLILG